MCVLVTHRTGALDEGGGRQPELSGLAWGRSHRETLSLPQVLRRALGRGKVRVFRKSWHCPSLALSSWLSHTGSLFLTFFSALK